jgi:hypothetical protein
MSEKELKPILVTLKPPGRPGGKQGVLLTNDLSRIPDGTTVHCDGKVFLDPNVTNEQLLNMSPNHIYLASTIGALRDGVLKR